MFNKSMSKMNSAGDKSLMDPIALKRKALKHLVDTMMGETASERLGGVKVKMSKNKLVSKDDGAVGTSDGEDTTLEHTEPDLGADDSMDEKKKALAMLAAKLRGKK